MVAQPITPRLGKLKQENHHKFKTGQNNKETKVAHRGREKKLLGKTITVGGMSKMARFELRPRGQS